MIATVPNYNQTINLSQLDLIVEQYKQIICDLDQEIAKINQKKEQAKRELFAIEALKNSQFISLNKFNDVTKNLSKVQVNQIVYSDIYYKNQEKVFDEKEDEETQYQTIAAELEQILKEADNKSLHESFISVWIAKTHPSFDRTSQKIRNLLNRGEKEKRWYKDSNNPYIWCAYQKDSHWDITSDKISQEDQTSIDKAEKNISFQTQSLSTNSNYTIIENSKQLPEKNQTPLQSSNLSQTVAVPLQTNIASASSLENDFSTNQELNKIQSKKNEPQQSVVSESTTNTSNKKSKDSDPAIKDLVSEYLLEIYPNSANVDMITDQLEKIIYYKNRNDLSKTIRSILSYHLNKLWERPKRGYYKAINS